MATRIAQRYPVGIGRPARVLHLDHVAPAVGLRAVDIGEAVLAREPAGGERAAVPAVHVRVGGERGDRAADEARALRDRGEMRAAAVASRQFASVTP